MTFIFFIIFMPRLEAWFAGLFGGGESVFVKPRAVNARSADLAKTGAHILSGEKLANDCISVDYVERTMVGFAEVVVTTSSGKIIVGIPIASRLRQLVKGPVTYHKQVREDPDDPFSKEVGSQTKTYPNEQRRDLYCVGLVYGNRNPDHRLDEELGFLVVDATNKGQEVFIFWPYDRLTPESQKIAIANYRANRLDPCQLSLEQRERLVYFNHNIPINERPSSVIPGGIGMRIG